MRRRAWWLALALLAGCVSGEPFAPEMCVVRSDSLAVRVSSTTLRTCALPQVQTKVVRP